MQTAEQPRVDPETLEFIYEATKEAPERQIAAGAALDTKIVQVLTAASVVMGFTGISSGWRPGSMSITGLLIGALAAYTAIAVFAIVQMWPTGFRQSRAAGQLWPKHWHESPSVIRHDLVADIHSSYVGNVHVLRRKAWTLYLSLVALAVEVGLVGAAVIVARLA
jgi:hypothetical protein